jgi:hypothetical protein
MILLHLKPVCAWDIIGGGEELSNICWVQEGIEMKTQAGNSDL